MNSDLVKKSYIDLQWLQS